MAHPLTHPCPWCMRYHDGLNCISGVVLVCGGRDYTDRDHVFAVLDRVARRVEFSTLRHGAARGADSLADEWARERSVTPDPFPVTPADWRRYGRGAGHRRNAAMLSAAPRVVCCIAFPGGSGTADMVSRCEVAGLPVWRVPGRP